MEGAPPEPETLFEDTKFDEAMNAVGTLVSYYKEKVQVLNRAHERPHDTNRTKDSLLI